MPTQEQGAPTLSGQDVRLWSLWMSVTLIVCSLAPFVAITYWLWSWFLFGWCIVILILSLVKAERLWTASGQRLCTALAWGLGASWAGIRFVGWSEPAPAEGGMRTDHVGFPIQGIERQVWVPGPGDSDWFDYGRFVPSCFEFASADWYLFLINSSALVGVSLVLCYRLETRLLRRAQVLGGWFAATMGFLAMIYLSQSWKNG